MNIITINEYNKNDLKNIFNEIRQKRIPTVIKKGINYFPNLYNWNKTYIINKFEIMSVIIRMIVDLHILI